MKVSPVLNFIGFLLIFLGMCMLLPAVWAYYYQEAEILHFIAAAMVTSGIGFALWRWNPSDPGIHDREGFAIVSFGWSAMAVFGALPFLLTGSIPSVTDAIFESMSGFTTTGASIISDVESLPKSVLFWRSFTHWLGGMGIIVISLAILPMLGIGGMQLFKAESPGPTKDKLTPRIRQTAALLWGVYVLLSILEAVLLKLCGMDLFEALCHTFGTMATGGFSTRNASIATYDNPWIHWVIILFMFIAGTNFTLHYQALRGKPLRYFRDAEFRYYGATVLIAVLAVLFSSWSSLRENGQHLRDVVFQVVSLLTTTGYVTADYAQWHPFAILILLMLMFIGGMAASTGGGMKVMRVVIVLKHAHIEIKKLIHPHAIFPLRFGKRIIAQDIATNVLGFFLLFIVIFVAGGAVLLMLGLDFSTALGASIACLANIGPGIGEVGPTGNYAALPGIAKWVLIVMMLMGRLELYTVLVLFSRSFWRR